MNYMDKRPSVTVLMPVRNGEYFINRSLENLIEITNSRDEILVINDGSTDSTLTLLQAWEKKCDRLNVISRKHFGLVSTLNFGLQEASNEVIARADVDDLYRKDRLDLQINLLKGKVGLIFSDYRFKSLSDKEYGIIPTAIFSDAMSLSLLASQRSPHPSAMFLRNAVIEVGGYLEDELLVEDLGLWFRMNSKFDIVGCPEVLLDYTLHENSISITKRKQMIAKRNLLRNSVVLKWSKPSLSESRISFILENYEKFSFSPRRRILFIRDLYVANKLGIQQTKKYRIFLYFFVWSTREPRMLWEFGILVIEMWKRKIVR